MNEFPISYVSKEFLEMFFKQRNKANVSIEEQHKIYLVEQILLYHSRIFVNLTDNQLENYNRPDYVPIDKDDEFFWKNFQVFCFQNKPGNKQDLIDCFKTSCYDIFDKLLPKPNYLFIHSTSEFCDTISREFGIICISEELNKIDELCEPYLKSIGRNVSIKMGKESELFKELPYCNEIVIRDPYIVEQGTDFIVQLIKSLVAIKVELRVRIFYELKGTFEADKQFRNSLQSKLVNEIPNLRKENIFIDTESRHNRHIYTNLYQGKRIKILSF